MIRGNIKLENPERFAKSHTISKSKIDIAVQVALEKLERSLPKWTDSFANSYTVDFKYPQITNCDWICGMQTGTYWLAYEMSGNRKFRDLAEKQLFSYKERLEKRIGVDDHDVGFVYMPSCAAAYKIIGNEEARQLALDAAEYYYHTSFSKRGGFIQRGWNWGCPEGCRTMMDTLMNVSFLFWAGNEAGKEEYIDAAISQLKITEQCLIREDGSSFHHYQFDPQTFQPVHGLTWQGYSDDSCWSRGQAWGVYGFPIAYSYCKEEFLLNLHRDVTYYLLNKLPEDLIPYWDFELTGNKDVVRDSSAGVIAVCGMHEMCKNLSEKEPQKRIFENASAQMLEAVIDQCTEDIGREYEGLICHVTHGFPQKQGIDECAVYADYFYLEALMRFINPAWERYW